MEFDETRQRKIIVEVILCCFTF